MLFPALAVAQYDFDTRYFTMDATALPEIESLTTFSLATTSKFSKKLPTFKMSRENYQQPVNMFEAVTSQQQYVNSELQIMLDAKEYGSGGYQTDGTTTVTNLAYKEATRGGLDFVSPCPPTGICPRCAPYRVGRGF